MGNYLDLFVITATTVGKILLCAVIGMFASRYFVEPAKSGKGLSYISVRILLPCLLFSNLCLTVSWESLAKFYWAPLLACVPLGLGLGSSFLFRLILARKYHALVMLGCTFQNGLTFPLSLVLNLKGIPWLTEADVSDAQSYIFLYNIVCSIGLWAIGEPLIAAARAKEVREEEAQRVQAALMEEDVEAAQRSVRSRKKSFAYPFQEEDAEAEHTVKVTEKKKLNNAHKTEDNNKEEKEREEEEESQGGSVSSGDTSEEKQNEGEHPQSRSREEDEENNDDGKEENYSATVHSAAKRNASVAEQLAWYRPAKAHDRPLKPRKPAVVSTDEFGHIVVLDAEEEDAVKDNKCSLRRISGIVGRSLMSPTVLFSIIAIVISLTPPLRWVAGSFGGQTLIGGLTVVGSGAIPLQLLVLGCTVASNKPKEGDDTSYAATATTTTTTTTTTTGRREKDNHSANSTNISGSGDTNVEITFGKGQNERHQTGPLAFLTRCASPSTVFIVCSVGLRMFILPGVCFLLIHLLRTGGLIPDERPFLIAMLVATCSPSAINSSVICSMHDYHSREYARMIFFMYITAILSTAVWLFVYVLYLND